MPRNFGTILLLCTYLLTNLQVVMQVHVCEMSGVSLQWHGAASPTCCAPQNQPMSCHAESKACQQPAERTGCCETESIDLRLALPQQVSKVLVVPTVAPLSPKITLALLPKSDEPPAMDAWFIDPPPPKVGLWRQHCASLTYG